MIDIEIRRALATLKSTRAYLIRKGLNNDGLEARYRELVEILMTELTILEIKSSWTSVH